MIIAKEYVKKMQNVKIIVNSFVEALGVVFILSDFKLNQPRKNKKYINEVKNHFSIFKNHEIVNDFRKLLKIDAFKYDAPIEFILNIANNVLPSYTLQQRGNFDLIKFKKLKENFITFYRDSKFDDFFKNKEEFYKKNITTFIQTVNIYSPHNYLFDILGMSSNNLNICLMHGITTANYGLNVNNKLYCCVRPYNLSRFNDIDFAFDMPYITSLILHEFAHSFINPLTDKYIKQDLINKEKLTPILEINGYGTHFETAINETIIRAIECLYIKKHFKAEFESFKNDYIQDGFTLIDSVMEFLDNYVNHKKQSDNIEFVYEQLLKIFYK